MTRVGLPARLPCLRAVSPGNAGAIELYPGDVTEDSRLLQLPGNFIPHYKTEALNFGTAKDPVPILLLGGGSRSDLPGTNPPNSLADTYTSTRTTSGWVTRYWGLRATKSLVAGGAKCDLGMNTCIDYQNEEPFRLARTRRTSRLSRALRLGSRKATASGAGRPTSMSSRTPRSTSATTALRPTSPTTSSPRSTSPSPWTARPGAPGSAYDNEIDNATGHKDLTCCQTAKTSRRAPAVAREAEEFIKFPAVSTDGSHILMTTEKNGGVNLYMRVDDAVTYEIASGNTGSSLIGMTSDGSKVVFASPDHVTPMTRTTHSARHLHLGRADRRNHPGLTGQRRRQLRRMRPERRRNRRNLLRGAAENRTARQRRPDRLRERRRLLLLARAARPGQPGCPQREKPLRLPARRRQIRRHLRPGHPIDRMQISPDGRPRGVPRPAVASAPATTTQGWREMYVFDPKPA